MMHDVDEEEIHFDQTGLLDSKKKVSRMSVWCHSMVKIFCLSLAFLSLGLCIAIPGPTLLDLQERVKADTTHMVFIFSARSVGYLSGALIGGFLFDIFDKQLLLSVTLFLASLATAIIPWSLTLVVLAVMFSVQGLAMGVLDTGGNTFCVRIWGKRSSPYMQVMHFAFGIGAFIAPLLTQPFLSPEVSLLSGNTSLTQGNIPVTANFPLQSFLDNVHNSMNRTSDRTKRDAFTPEHLTTTVNSTDTFSVSMVTVTMAVNTSDNRNNTKITKITTTPVTIHTTTTPKPKKPGVASDIYSPKETSDGSDLAHSIKDIKNQIKDPEPKTKSDDKKDQLTAVTPVPSTTISNTINDHNATDINETSQSSPSSTNTSSTTVTASSTTTVATTTTAQTITISTTTPTTTTTSTTTTTTLAPTTTTTTLAPTTTTTTLAPTTTTPSATSTVSTTTTSKDVKTTEKATTAPQKQAVTSEKPKEINPINKADQTKGISKDKFTSLIISTVSAKNLSSENGTDKLKPTINMVDLLNSAVDAVKHMSKIQFSYLIISALLMVNAVVFLILYCYDKRQANIQLVLAEREKSSSVENPCARLLILMVMFLFFLSYIGIETTFGGLIMTFTVEYMSWTKKQGAIVTSIFWGSLAAGRGFSVFIAGCCKPRSMLIIDLSLMVIGAGMLSFVVKKFSYILWMGTLALGLGMSSIFPTGLSWSEQYFRMTGKSTAVLVTGSALGQMIVPVVTGYVFQTQSQMYLMYVVLMLTVLCVVLFTLMQVMASKCSQMKGRLGLQNGFMPLNMNNDDGLELEGMDYGTTEDSTRHRRLAKNGENGYDRLPLIDGDYELDDDI